MNLLSATLKTAAIALVLTTTALTPVFAQTTAPAAMATTASKPDADMAEVQSTP